MKGTSEYHQRMIDERRLRDAQAATYESHLSPYHHRVEIGHYVKAIRPSRGDLVLDAGGGTGRVARAIATMDAHVVVADLSLQSLRTGRAKARKSSLEVAQVQCDLSALPFERHVFNAVVCAEVLEHVPERADRVAILASLIEATLPRGRIVVSVYGLNLKRRLLGQRTVVEGRNHDHYFSMGEFRSELEAAAVTARVKPARLKLYPILTLLHMGVGPRLGHIGEQLDAALSRLPASGHIVGSLLVGEITLPSDHTGGAPHLGSE